MVTSLLGVGDPAEIVQNEEFLWLVSALVGALLLGAIVFSWIERWRKRQLSNTPANEITQIGSFRTMFERGELTKEEYDRIKSKEAQRLRDKLVTKPTATKPLTAPPVQPSPQEPELPSPPVS